MYLDAAASTPIAPEVLEAMKDVERIMGNPFSKHPHGQAAYKLIDKSLKTMAGILNVSPDQLVLTHGGTDGNRKVIWELQKKIGLQNIWCSCVEHSSIADEIPTSQYFDPNNPSLKNAGAIMLMHSNNETGRIYNVENLCKKYPEAIIVQDWVQSTGKVDFDPTHCDFATISAHKFYGPKGVGLLYIKNPEHFPNLSKDSHTKDPVTAVGMAKAMELMSEYPEGKIKVWQEKIETFLKRTFPECKIHDEDASRIFGIINVAFPHKRGSEIMMHLAGEEVSISTGSACQSDIMSPTRVIQSIEPDPKYQYPIRISLHQYLTDEDIEDFCEILEEYVK